MIRLPPRSARTYTLVPYTTRFRSDKRVLDWRRKSAKMASVRTEIRDVLDADLPADPYPSDVFNAKVQAVFDHVATVYGDDGTSVYEGDTVRSATSSTGLATLAAGAISTAALTDEVVEQLRDRKSVV